MANNVECVLTVSGEPDLLTSFQAAITADDGSLVLGRSLDDPAVGYWDYSCENATIVPFPHSLPGFVTFAFQVPNGGEPPQEWQEDLSCAFPDLRFELLAGDEYGEYVVLIVFQGGELLRGESLVCGRHGVQEQHIFDFVESRGWDFGWARPGSVHLWGPLPRLDVDTDDDWCGPQPLDGRPLWTDRQDELRRADACETLALIAGRFPKLLQQIVGMPPDQLLTKLATDRDRTLFWLAEDSRRFDPLDARPEFRDMLADARAARRDINRLVM